MGSTEFQGVWLCILQEISGASLTVTSANATLPLLSLRGKVRAIASLIQAGVEAETQLEP